MKSTIHNNIDDYDLFLECVDYSDDKTPEQIGEMSPEEMVNYLGYNSISEYIAEKKEEELEAFNPQLSGREYFLALRSVRAI